MRILIVRLSAMGDAVCTLPVATALKRLHPESEITWVVDQRFKAIVEMSTAVDHVVALPKKEWLPKLEGAFDLAIDMQGLTKSGVIVGFAKAKKKVGYHWQREFARVFSSPVLPDPKSIHVVEQYMDVARAMGSDSVVDFGIEVPSEAVESAGAKLPTNRFAVIHPGAGWSTKRWSMENLIAIANQIAEASVVPVIIGAKAEEESAAQLSAAVPQAVNLASQTNMKELAAVLQRSEFVVAGDTGASHLAAALGKQVVGIYLATRPERSSPYGQLRNCPEPTLKNIQSKVAEFC